ncbi:uncharacterized protein N7483_013220 [Penicillium malachiteum]|uniref:uncharacterized protein n=1 Tax=Penicillium malachiteum TaxID=1324776 RepID=UPI0025484009|nr:uncharacterized protein N7483_013220 [Penicillium malachiteum]KAJ5716039.1 hypothetical protein N7483_013220 [Penicillium malachiteum]
MNGSTPTDLQVQRFTCPHCLKLCFLPGVWDYRTPVSLGSTLLPATSLDDTHQRVAAFGRPSDTPLGTPIGTPNPSPFAPVFGAPALSARSFFGAPASKAKPPDFTRPPKAAFDAPASEPELSVFTPPKPSASSPEFEASTLLA